MKYGYLRMTLNDSDISADTSEDPEVTRIKEKQVSEKNIFIDIQDRKDQYDKLVKKLKSGDVLYLGSLTDLGQGYEDIIKQWRLITEDSKADIAVMDIPLLDTRIGNDSLGSDYVSRLTQQLLQFAEKYDAEKEHAKREERRRLQAEGITIAKMKGVRFGKHARKLPDDFENIVRRQKNKEISADDAAKLCGIARSTYYYWARKVSAQKLE